MLLIDILSTKPNEYLFLPKDSRWIANSADQQSTVAAIQKLFEPDWLINQNLVNKTASGRGLVYFFNALNENCVLRHYYRGGLMAKVSKDKFLFRQLKSSRPFQELTLLAHLYAAGLNVPKPIAARLRHTSLQYTADIITGAIPRTQELHEQLLHHPIKKSIWIEIGATLRKMHDLQACH
jgi:3-deoxy-D-manno-octulosonic acid kinase